MDLLHTNNEQFNNATPRNRRPRFPLGGLIWLNEAPAMAFQLFAKPKWN